jgi:DNA primase
MLESKMPHQASQAVPILSVAESLGLEMVGSRTNCFNRDHHAGGEDEHPSLTFFADSNRFKCFVCGIKGDSIDLVRAVRGVGFQEAADWILALAANSSTSARPTARLAGSTGRVPDLAAIKVFTAMYELSTEVSSKTLGGKYLKRRNLDLKLAAQHGVTEIIDSDDLLTLLSVNLSEENLRAAGLMTQHGRFLFGDHKLLLFYFDGDRPVYVQARDLTGEAHCKELSLAGLRSPVPYNVDALANSPETVMVCEGAIDTLSAVQLGYAAVGVPGVTGFRDEWFPLFRGIRRVTIVFDNDEAGRRQGVELRAQFRRRRICADVVFPSCGKDVNDLLKSLSQRSKS